MKTNFILLLAVMAILTSCSKTEIIPKSELIVNGSPKSLAYGVLDDEGTNLDPEKPYRTYTIWLRDLESSSPENSIEFTLYSTSTYRLEEGVYSYYNYREAGKFYHVNVENNIKYDSKGVQIEGTVLSSSYLDTKYNNTITVGKSGDNKMFTYDLQFIKNEKTFNVTGTYRLSLTEGNL